MNINDRELLARTLQAEAGNQGFGGMMAAGSVIMNRTNAAGYGNGLRGVILKPGQFSAWNSRLGPDGKPVYAGGAQGQDMANMRASDDAYKAADALITGGYEDKTGGATHYYNPSFSNPDWGRDKAGGDWKQIGDHVFGFADAGKKPNSNQAIADDTSRALGKSPKGILAPTQTSETETTPMINQQKPRGLLENIGIQKMQEGAEGETGQRFYNRDSFKDTAALLGQGFGRMGIMGMEGLADQVASQRTEAKARNKTVAFLRKAKRNDLADAVEGGSLGARDAAGIMFAQPDSAPSAFQALAYQAKAAGLQEGTPEYQEFMLAGGGSPATYRALKMQAEAAGFVEGTPEFQDFMATRGAGLQAGARQTSTNVANIETGGAAAEAIATGTATGKEVVEKGSELSEMQRNIKSLRVTIDQLSVLSDVATYTSLGRVGNEIRKQLGLEPSEGAVARTEYIAVVNNQILPLLRQTFGAAFTAAEGDTLRATLGDPNVTPAEKKVVLNAFIAQKERDLAARQSTSTASGETSTASGTVDDDPLGLRN